MRKHTLIANFKSNKSQKQMQAWIEEFGAYCAQDPSIFKNLDLILCPPAIHLHMFEKLCATYPIHLGLQDISAFPAGSYTGALCAQNLDGMYVSHAIVGHSERRTYFHETDNDIANKVRECIAAAITPILCLSNESIDGQASALSKEEKDACIIAYEPTDYIGAGETDSLEHIEAFSKRVAVVFGENTYLYGGSVDTHTARDIFSSPHINGFLVGSACLQAKDLFRVLRRVC